eukprot:TRINITY_DN43751_c0_g1_i1.p1 TRINITY_DN43751_c0_g1~~TRINITY_DN43751_c0_g1_i1.p1  ORF type:complete len:322 (+),score=46.25 TRINITY_DN43751_c0_g1_i1:45-968(+)
MHTQSVGGGMGGGGWAWRPPLPQSNPHGCPASTQGQALRTASWRLLACSMIAEIYRLAPPPPPLHYPTLPSSKERRRKAGFSSTLLFHFTTLLLRCCTPPHCAPCRPPKMPGGAEGGGCLHRAAVSEAVDRYGEAWARQDEDAIASLFTEEGRYVERIGNDVGTFVGRDAIRKYWRKQIRGKQSDIQFRHVVEDMVLDSARSTATVKWVASFTNRHTVTRETATVEFTQIAILTFVYVPHREESAQGFLVSQLEEYWHSPNTDKRAKGAVYPKREKQRNRSRNLQANLARVRALGLRPPSLADYAMS